MFMGKILGVRTPMTCRGDLCILLLFGKAPCDFSPEIKEEAQRLLNADNVAVSHLSREIYRDAPRCPFFTRDCDDYVKNQCVFTWFVKVMVLTMVFGMFSSGFPMYFHGESFWESPYSS